MAEKSKAPGAGDGEDCGYGGGALPSAGTDIVALPASKAGGSTGLRSGAREAAMPARNTPGRVSSASGGGAVGAPKRAKGSAFGVGAKLGGSAGDCAVAGCAMSRVTRKVWPHLLQRTFTPLSVTFSSGILNRV